VYREKSCATEGIITDFRNFYKVERCSNLEGDENYFRDYVWAHNQPLKITQIKKYKYTLPNWLDVDLAKKAMKNKI